MEGASYSSVMDCMKGLEALENIIETFYDKESEDIQVVRKELKDYECLNSFFQKLKDKYEIDDLDYLERICQNHKKLVKKERALEIIKNTLPIHIFETLDRKYKMEVCVNIVGLTKEEYDLLKEILKNE